MTQTTAHAQTPIAGPRLRENLELFKLWRNERNDPGPFYTRARRTRGGRSRRSVGPLAGQRIADIGCGPGWYTHALRARGAEGAPHRPLARRARVGRRGP